MKKHTTFTLFILCFIILVSISYSQNITNRLATGGIFSITDGVTTFFSLTRSNGQVGIPGSLFLLNTTDSATGVVYLGTNRFIHNYKGLNTNGFNTFAGVTAGNFTISGTGSEGSYNTGLGYTSLRNLTTGSYNTGVGKFSLQNNTTGSHNTAYGCLSLTYNITGSYNTSIGSTNNGGNFNHNTTIGTRTMSNINTSTERNIILGNFIFGFRTVGSTVGNVFIGYAITWDFGNAQFNNCIGIGDSIINTGASYWLDDIVTIGARSFMHIGYHATGNTALGYEAGTGASKVNNRTYIGYLSTDASYSQTVFVLGNNMVTTLRCNVTSITSLSDLRDKKNINELSQGLEFISALKPRMFNWDKREWYNSKVSDGSKIESKPTAGFIAQELDSAQKLNNADWLGLVDTDNPERYEATTGNLLPVLVNAIQQLKERTDRIKEQTLDINESTNEIDARIVKLQKNYQFLNSRLEEEENK